mmetsp:Transcript_7553/g.19221  ORF Transcript_7553/g.19221 Transcript_7553/m.19221 type:complete len:202 (+) Transcript_7553:872-1477(+)
MCPLRSSRPVGPCLEACSPSGSRAGGRRRWRHWRWCGCGLRRRRLEVLRVSSSTATQSRGPRPAFPTTYCGSQWGSRTPRICFRISRGRWRGSATNWTGESRGRRARSAPSMRCRGWQPRRGRASGDARGTSPWQTRARTHGWVGSFTARGVTATFWRGCAGCFRRSRMRRSGWPGWCLSGQSSNGGTRWRGYRTHRRVAR